MRRKRLGILAPAPLLALVGVGAATVFVSDGGSRLAVPLLGGIGVLLTVVVAGVARDDRDAVYLRNLMLLGVAVRFLVLALVHQTVGPYVFAPDQYTYESWGQGLLGYFVDGGPFPSRLEGTVQVGYPAMNAGLFLVFGPAMVAPAVVNIFLSAWTALPIYSLSRAVLPDQRGVARLAAGLTVLFPSLVLWSTLNIREAPTILTTACAVYFLVRLQQKADGASLVGVVVSLGVLTLFREYLTSLVGMAGAAGVLMGRSRSPVRSLALGSLLLLGLTFAFQNLGLGASLTGEPSLERAQLLRESFQVGAGSAYGQGADVSTPGGALLYLPVGLAYFLLAPFPWEISSLLQLVALPETLVWWGMVPFAFWGALLVLKRDPRNFTVPLAVLITVTFAYALVESNVGTAYRHRGQILPIAFVLCALGIRELGSSLRARRKARAERRKRAREALRRRGVARPVRGSR